MEEKEKLEAELIRINQQRAEFDSKYEPEYREAKHYKEVMAEFDLREKITRKKLDKLKG